MPTSRSDVAIILIKLLRLIVLVWINGNNNSVECTIDVNLPELEYLAAHLSPSECRHLVAALHYKTFELPRSLEAVGMTFVFFLSLQIVAKVPVKLLLKRSDKKPGRLK